MLYRMLTGRPPFLAEGSGAIMAMHIYEKPTAIRDLDLVDSRGFGDADSRATRQGRSRAASDGAGGASAGATPVAVLIGCCGRWTIDRRRFSSVYRPGAHLCRAV